MKKILLLGSQGQIGWELQRMLPQENLFAYDRSQVDLLQPEALKKCIRDVKPQIIINAAAYTAVDKAESEKEIAFAVNGNAPQLLAEEAKKHHALLIHYSTDYVFDGTKQEPYIESDPTNPANVYGQSKLFGEKAITASGCQHLILRTSWVYAARGKNFMLTMLKLADERDLLRVVGDQYGIPNWSHSLAQSTMQLIAQFRPELSGIYHLSASNPTTWYGFAQTIFSEYKILHPEFRVPKIESITSAEYPTPAKRPLNSVLNTNKIQHNFSITIHDWKISLCDCLKLLQKKT